MKRTEPGFSVHEIEPLFGKLLAKLQNLTLFGHEKRKRTVFVVDSETLLP